MRYDKRRYWSMVTMLSLVPLAGAVSMCKTAPRNNTSGESSPLKTGEVKNKDRRSEEFERQ